MPKQKQHHVRCKTPFCRNARRRDGRDCHKCNMRKWRAAQPMRSAYRTLKDHAVARAIEFTISFDCFRELAERCDYVGQKGNFACSLTVDRKDNLKGYVPGNIQPMTRSENAVKRCKSDAIRMQQGYAWPGRRAA